MSAGARPRAAAVDLAALTAELIAIPSVSGDEGAIADRVAAELSAVSGETVRIGHNVVHRGPRRAGRPTVVLAGHLDTVPAQGNAVPRRDGDLLFGLGASDMKAGIAVQLALARTLDVAAARFDLAWVFYECEEVALERNGLRRLWRETPWLAEAALAIVLEPTGGAVELGCQGSVNAECTVRGRSAHSSRPWLGDNALYKALPLLGRLAALEPRNVETGGVTYRETWQVTLARGGIGRNVVPDAFTFNLNHRYAPTRTPEQAVADLRALLEPEAEVAIVDVAPPAAPRADHPLVAEFLSRFSLQRRAKQAWTDVAQFAERGVAAINFGPGVPELAHRADEHVPVAHLDPAYEVLRVFLETAP